MFETSGLKHTNLYEVIADRIEDIIINDPSMVGERLPSEQSVADEFGVSRNVVREAFKVLKETRTCRRALRRRSVCVEAAT